LFVERPILSAVIAALILLAGAASIPSLPIAEFPQITPPQVVVTSTYIGADAGTVEAAVTNPLEEEINGVQGLKYMSSTSSNAGVSTITMTFDPSRNVDLAAVDVQNRVQDASGELPTAVTQTGVQITKSSGSFIMAIAFKTSDPSVTPLILSNFLDRNIKDPLLRIDGVSAATIFGERLYAMRIWLDPRKMQFYGLGASDITTAVANQNVQVPAGSIGAEPAPANQAETINVHVPGELADATAFGNIIVKNGTTGSIVRLSQVARVELGAQDYASNLRYDRKTALGVGIQINSGANALAVAQNIRKTLDTLKPTFPAGVSYEVPYDSTLFVSESLHEVLITLAIAIALVVATIYLFLQNWRTTLIPVITIPISLIGTFAFVNIFGFSINTLVLFGITLATGLVVDDAIVVIENISRVIRDAESETTRRESTIKGLGEIVGAVIATSLVLLAVFIPTAVISGTTGAIYKQFALTIAFAIAISMVLALTLTPALAGVLMEKEKPPKFFLFRIFNAGLARVTALYARALEAIVRFRYLVAAGLVALLVLTALLFTAAPSGFLPDEDQGVLFATVQAPDGASLNVTGAAARQLEDAAFRNPNVAHVFSVSGTSFAGAGTNQGIIFIALKPWGERKTSAALAEGVIADLAPAAARIPQASVFLFNPPSIPGLGTTGGFDFELEDYQSGPLAELGAAAGKLIGAANENPGLSRVFTTFRASGPEIDATVRRTAVAQLGATLPDVFNDISTALGSTYVNNFTYQDRTYRVYVQNDGQFRKDALDVSRIAVPNASASASNAVTSATNPNTGTTSTTSIGSGVATVPLGSVVDVTRGTGAPSITHYDLYRSVEIQGNSAAGHSSGQAITAMQDLTKSLLSTRYHYQWTGISLDETQSGSTTLIVFALGLTVVYLVLAALYESVGNPLVILLSVPAALLGAVGALMLRHITSDVYAQVGYVMLIGLAAKNAILIVEFSIQERATGKSARDAVVAAAETRLRPILMTSIAFIAGLLPLVFASGAGAASRHSLGTAVIGGMIVSTVVNLIVVPAMYLIIDDIGVRLGRLFGPKPAAVVPTGATTV
jgi:HAE1 family hydrophobic/amphiphilic exporter-1